MLDENNEWGSERINKDSKEWLQNRVQDAPTNDAYSGGKECMGTTVRVVRPRFACPAFH